MVYRLRELENRTGQLAFFASPGYRTT